MQKIVRQRAPVQAVQFVTYLLIHVYSIFFPAQEYISFLPPFHLKQISVKIPLEEFKLAAAMANEGFHADHERYEQSEDEPQTPGEVLMWFGKFEGTRLNQLTDNYRWTIYRLSREKPNAMVCITSFEHPRYELTESIV